MELKIIPDPFDDDSTEIRAGAQPGEMWRAPWMDVDGLEAWAIVLPNKTVWYTTQDARDGRWQVTGIPPLITVRPSIWDQDPEHGWHGFITDGRMESV